MVDGPSPVAAPGAGAPTLDRSPQRPRLDVPIGDEAVLDRPRNRLPEQALDAAEEVCLVDADEADRLARRSGPTRPPDPMDVVLRVPRELEVHDMREVLDVEAARRDVRGDEDADLAGLELLQGAGPLRLGPIAVDRDRVEALAIEPRREARRPDLRPREDQDLAEIVLADQMRQQLFLPIPIDGVDDLADRLDRGVPRGDLDLGRIAEDGPRQPPDLVRERRREHQVLPSRRQELDDPLDVRQEAHVEHPVGLVQDEDLDLAEVRHPLADEVEQAARRRYEDLHAGAERLDL